MKIFQQFNSNQIFLNTNIWGFYLVSKIGICKMQRNVFRFANLIVTAGFSTTISSSFSFEKKVLTMYLK